MRDSDRTASWRWASDDLQPGSAFHKTVAVPTLLPDAAQPYVLPGMCPGTSTLDKSSLGATHLMGDAFELWYG